METAHHEDTILVSDMIVPAVEMTAMQQPGDNNTGAMTELLREEIQVIDLKIHHAATILGPKLPLWTSKQYEDKLEEKLEEMKRIKGNVRSFAHSRISMWMLQAAQEGG